MAAVWKGEVDPTSEAPEFAIVRVFDWKSCSAALEVRTRVSSHLLHHGSVSPSWQEEALILEHECRQSMISTADAIAEILRRRRSQYLCWESSGP